MAEVIFSLNGVQTKIKCEKEDLMKDIIKKFSIANATDTSNMLLLYKGNRIDPNATFYEQANEEDKAKNMINISCMKLYKKRNSIREVKIDSSNKRKSLIFNPRISMKRPIHFATKTENLFDNSTENPNKNSIRYSFRKTIKKVEINDKPPKIDQSAINNNSLNFDKMFNYNEFFRPYSCHIDLTNKSQNMGIADYNSTEINSFQRNTTQEIYKNDLAIENRIEKDIKEFQTKFEAFNNKIKEIINSLNQISENINLFYEVTYDKMQNLELVEKDGDIILDIKDLVNNYEKFINNIDKIIQNSKITNTQETFNKIMNSYKESNKDIIKYKINEGENIVKIFGSNFVINNWDNCSILCEDKEYRLTENFDTRLYTQNNKVLEIKLKINRGIKDLSFMFSDCTSLISLSKIITWNTENVISMKGMFSGCTSLKSLPDLSKIKTDNVKNMRGLFAGCESLLSIPDISEWNTENVTDMQYMFHNCSKLKTLPDISKWNTKNVIDMRFMFYNCSSLIALPDISKWNIKKVTSMQGIFEGCSSLFSLPNISKWEVSNKLDMRNMFNKCKKTLRVPGKFKRYMTYNKLEPKGK